MAGTPCADAFVAAAPGDHAPPDELVALDQRLRAWHERASRALPELRVAPESFATSVARSETLLSAARGSDPPDLSDDALAEVLLAAAVRAQDSSALALFEKRYVATLDGALAKMRLDAATLDDVKQRLRERLILPEPTGETALETYAGAGRLLGLVRVAATRIALDLLRSGRPDRRADDLLDELPGAARDPELETLKARYRGEFRAAFEAAVGGLEARERNLLRFHLLGGVTLEKLAAMYGVHRATVVRWLAGARESLLKSTRRDLQARLGVNAGELDSLMKLVESGFDVSVERIFRADSDA